MRQKSVLHTTFARQKYKFRLRQDHQSHPETVAPTKDFYLEVNLSLVKAKTKQASCTLVAVFASYILSRFSIVVAVGSLVFVGFVVVTIALATVVPVPTSLLSWPATSKPRWQ